MQDIISFIGTLVLIAVDITLALLFSFMIEDLLTKG